MTYMWRSLWPIWPLLLGVACVSAQAMQGSAALGFERHRLASEPWRLLTAHLVHLNWAHLGLNLAALGLIVLLSAPILRPRQWLLGWCFISLVVSGGLYFCTPTIQSYAGASGVLHGMLAGYVVSLLRRGSASACWLLVGLAVKLAWEQYAGPTPGVAALIGGAVIVEAHWYGVLGGVLWGVSGSLHAPLIRYVPHTS